MVTVETLLDVVPAASVAVALVYYGLQIRNQNKAREAQMYITIWDKFSDPGFLERYFEVQNHEWTDFEDYLERYAGIQQRDPMQFARTVSVGTMLEGVGVLVKRGFLNPLYVADLMASIVLNYWEKRRDVTVELRRRWGNPRIWEQIEVLYDRIKPIAEEQHPELKT